MIIWSEANDRRLKALKREGLTPARIAEQLSQALGQTVTAKAVASRLFRLRHPIDYERGPYRRPQRGFTLTLGDTKVTVKLERILDTEMPNAPTERQGR